MELDLEIELRLLLKRSPMPVHILNTDDGMIITHDYPYHGERFVKIPRELEGAILDFYAPSHT